MLHPKKLYRNISFLFCLLTTLLGCHKHPYEISVTRELMGTLVKITVYHQEVPAANQAINNAFQEMQRIEELMSVHREDSLVGQVNKLAAQQKVKISPDLFYLLEYSCRISKVSEGAFDITVAPLIKLWSPPRRPAEEAWNKVKVLNQAPTEDKIKGTLALVGWEKLVLDRRDKTISFEKPGMGIDLGGIAKGYAVDRAIRQLTKAGIKHALIDAGGDIRVLGSKPGDRPWKVALRNPRDKNDYLTLLALVNRTVATSGDYERYFFQAGKRISHILDPATGYPAQDCISATIIAETALQADALATAVFVLGPQKGLKLIEKLDNVETLIVDKDRRIFRSRGFGRYEE